VEFSYVFKILFKHGCILVFIMGFISEQGNNQVVNYYLFNGFCCFNEHFKHYLRLRKPFKYAHILLQAFLDSACTCDAFYTRYLLSFVCSFQKMITFKQTLL
ncbi:hypothetical protein RZS08_44435, partial [Arthrospira platensis SPKY1]|nr:hypothetical protein [Arthrospira platensis SPKY1]